jgi:hypothetical protein
MNSCIYIFVLFCSQHTCVLGLKIIKSDVIHTVESKFTQKRFRFKVCDRERKPCGFSVNATAELEQPSSRFR